MRGIAWRYKVPAFLVMAWSMFAPKIAKSQPKPVESTGLSLAEVPAFVFKVLAAPGQPLDAAPRNAMESRLGYDFSGVRVHDDGRAAAAAQAINARAFTARNNVVFGAGQYSPDTAAGQDLLAHELTHVTQQQGAAPGVASRPGGRPAAGAGPLIIQRQVASAGTEPALPAQASDITAHAEVRGQEIVTTKTLQREGLQSRLVTVFSPVTMTSTQRLFRRSARSPGWTDVTAQALNEKDLNPPGVDADELSVEWNMPLFKPAPPADGIGQQLAENIISEIPPSLVIPYVKDSTLTEHFEFSPPGENPYQHWVGTIGRRWSATGARKTSFWLNKVTSLASAGVEATGAAAFIGRGASSVKAGSLAPDVALPGAARSPAVESPAPQSPSTPAPPAEVPAPTVEIRTPETPHLGTPEASASPHGTTPTRPMRRLPGGARRGAVSQGAGDPVAHPADHPAVEVRTPRTPDYGEPDYSVSPESQAPDPWQAPQQPARPTAPRAPAGHHAATGGAAKDAQDLVDQRKGVVGMQEHRTAPAVRGALGQTGQGLDSTHLVPQAVYRAIGRSPDVALTVNFPKSVNNAIDSAWVPKWNNAVRLGQRITGGDVREWITAGLRNVPEKMLNQATRNTLEWAFENELRSLGISDDTVVVPGLH
jgi:Domain of unknown function (DUF4157)